MKRFIPIYIIALCALCLTACENGEENPQIELKDIPITLEAAVTRADESNLQDEGFGVWAFINNSVQTNYAYMENVLVKNVGGEWVYSPAKYWLDDTRFTFVATYPYDEEGTIYTINPSTGAVQLTLSDTPSAQDYLVATNTIDTNATNFDPSKKVELTFKHILSKVSINVWREGVKHQNDQMRIRKVTLSNIRKAGTYSSTTDTWAPTNEKLAMVYENNTLADSDNIGGASKKDDSYVFGGVASVPFNELMLLPQTIDASNNIALKIEYELKRQNAADWEAAELETVLPATTWDSGKEYTYNVVLSQVTDITVYYIQTKVDPWGTPQVGGTVIIK
ncbi:MAG: fimbrillin family protein [Alistipes sp.]|nr:fimbrillin family protein [Alistipes sp.]